MKDNTTNSFDQTALLTFDFLLFVAQKHEPYTEEMFTAMDVGDGAEGAPDSKIDFDEYKNFLTIQNLFLKAIQETDTADVETLLLTDAEKLADFTVD